MNLEELKTLVVTTVSEESCDELDGDLSEQLKDLIRESQRNRDLWEKGKDLPPEREDIQSWLKFFNYIVETNIGMKVFYFKMLDNKISLSMSVGLSFLNISVNSHELKFGMMTF